MRWQGKRGIEERALGPIYLYLVIRQFPVPQIYDLQALGLTKFEFALFTLVVVVLR